MPDPHAFVGAAYAASALDQLEDFVVHLRKSDVVRFMDFGLTGGLLKGERLMADFHAHFADRPIEQLTTPYGAVATALRTGEEVWLRTGSLIEAVHASIALPGIFRPVTRDGVQLVDGGLVNPVPVSLARAMGAEIVIAVDLSSDLLGRHFRAKEGHASSDEPETTTLQVIMSSMDIAGVRIARSRLAEDPPEVTITPHMAHLRLLDFHSGQEGIDEGYRAVERAAQLLAGLAPLVRS